MFASNMYVVYKIIYHLANNKNNKNFIKKLLIINKIKK